MRAKKVETSIRREQIALAAMNLLSLYGSKGLTNKRIANMVGIVPSALYKHFKNKGEILDAIGELLVKRMQNLISKARKDFENPITIIRQVYLAEIRLIIQSPGSPFLLFYGEFGNRESKYGKRFHQIGQTYIGELEKLFGRAVSMELIRSDLTPETLSMFYAGMIFQSGFIMYTRGVEREIIEHSELAWKSFMEMLQKK